MVNAVHAIALYFHEVQCCYYFYLCYRDHDSDPKDSYVSRSLDWVRLARGHTPIGILEGRRRYSMGGVGTSVGVYPAQQEQCVWGHTIDFHCENRWN